MVVKLVEVHSHHGINRGQTFTRIFLDQGQGGHSIVVVGDPLSVDRKLTEGQRQVLRG